MMEKGDSYEMDLDEWELLPDEGLLKGKSVFFKEKKPFHPKGSVHLDYFMCPSDPSEYLLEEVDDLSKNKNKRQFKDPVVARELVDEEFVKDIKEINIVPPPMIVAEDREQEFADTKAAVEQIGCGQESNKDGGMEGEKYGEDKEKGCWDGFGLSIWRWRLTGVGALCSIGVAAATICIFILGGHQRQKQQHQNQKLQFQIYSDEKNLKQVVQHATRLNQAMSAVRGLPVPRANISFGGYYDGL